MISVIMPFFESERWVGRCLASMAKQRGELEFICVDDASTDNGREIAERYASEDSRFKILDNRHAKGVSGARNTGIEMASGDFITFVDADDELVDDAEYYYKQAVGIEADIYQLNHLRWYAHADTYATKYENCSGWYDINHLPQCWCMVWNKVYPKSIIGHTRFDERMQFGEDELFNLELIAKAKRIYHVRECSVIHRFDNRGSLSKVKQAGDLLLQVHILEEFLHRQTDEEVRRATCRVIGEHWRSAMFLDSIGRNPKDI